jgi:hypothetical protein
MMFAAVDNNGLEQPGELKVAASFRATAQLLLLTPLHSLNEE